MALAIFEWTMDRIRVLSNPASRRICSRLFCSAKNGKSNDSNPGKHIEVRSRWDQKICCHYSCNWPDLVSHAVATARTHDMLHVRLPELRLDWVCQRVDQTAGRRRRTGTGNCAAENHRSEFENVPQDGTAKFGRRQKRATLWMNRWHGRKWGNGLLLKPLVIKIVRFVNYFLLLG